MFHLYCRFVFFIAIQNIYSIYHFNECFSFNTITKLVLSMLDSNIAVPSIDDILHLPGHWSQWLIFPFPLTSNTYRNRKHGQRVRQTMDMYVVVGWPKNNKSWKMKYLRPPWVFCVHMKNIKIFNLEHIARQKGQVKIKVS